MPEPGTWSRTFIEQHDRLGKRHHLVGWSVAPDGGALVGGEVRAWPSTKAVVESMRLGPSPDIMAGFPGCPAAGMARFEGVVMVEEPSPHGTVLALRPRFEGGQGRTCVLGDGLPAIPPRFFERIGSGVNEGLDYFGRFLDLELIDEGSRVLDVGCGAGRMAIPLARFLSRGRYVGLDIDAELLAWCEKNAAGPHSGFRFRRLDVANGLYRPGEAARAETVEFPVDAGTFDFACATSLFTHLQEREAVRYFEQLARALAPTGSLLATFFIVDEFARAAIDAGKSSCSFVPFGRDAFVTDPAVPERVIGFPREKIVAWAQASGLEVVASLPGSWCGRARPEGSQDTLVFRRRSA